MKLINEAIKQKGLSLKKLPQEIQDSVADLRKMILKFNDEVKEYEKEEEEDEEKEKHFDKLEDQIAKKDQKIADQIKAYEEPAPEPAPAPDPVPAPAPDPAPAPEEKKDSSVGWLIFGGVVLALTLGAVNMMKKK